MLIDIFSIVAFGCIVGSLLFCGLYVILEVIFEFDFKIKIIGRNFILITCILIITSIINFNTKTETYSVNAKYTAKYTKNGPCDELNCTNLYGHLYGHAHYIFTNSHGKKMDICSEGKRTLNSDISPSKIKVIHLRINRLKIVTFYSFKKG